MKFIKTTTPPNPPKKTTTEKANRDGEMEMKLSFQGQQIRVTKRISQAEGQTQRIKDRDEEMERCGERENREKPCV